MPRPNVKEASILKDLRRQIVEGRYAPEQRLPSKADLAERFKVSSGTVQKVVDRLREDGFVETRGANGTYVHAKPPHLTTFAVIIPYPKPDHKQRPEELMGYESALHSVVRDMPYDPDLRIQLFDDIDPKTRSGNYCRLVDDVKSHRLGGLVFFGHPFRLRGTPVMTEPSMPRVSVLSSEGTDPGTPSLRMESAVFIGRAMAKLRELGCKRPALLSPIFVEPMERWVAQAQRETGLTIPDRWRLYQDPLCGQGARNAMRLMFDRPAEDRPDALIIADDNFVPDATLALNALGRGHDRDLVVVAHANFPVVTPSYLPAIRLGLDVHDVVRRALDALKRLRQGDASTELGFIHSVFENEISNPPFHKETEENEDG